MKLVKPHGNVELVKGLRKPKGQECPREKTKGTQEPISRRTNDHAKPLRERVNAWPKEAQQD